MMRVQRRLIEVLPSQSPTATVSVPFRPSLSRTPVHLTGRRGMRGRCSAAGFNLNLASHGRGGEYGVTHPLRIDDAQR